MGIEGGFIGSPSPPMVTFGRLPSCDVCLPDDLEVSRRDARLSWNNGWWLKDLGSSNKSFLREFQHARKISEPALLSVGQIFMLSRTRFRLEPGSTASVYVASQARAEKS